MTNEWKPPNSDEDTDDFIAGAIYGAYGEYHVIWPPEDRRVYARYLMFAAAVRRALSSDEGQPYLKRMLKP